MVSYEAATKKMASDDRLTSRSLLLRLPWYPAFPPRFPLAWH
jgi:hypothetical protein